MVEDTTVYLDPSNPFAFSCDQLKQIVENKELDVLKSIGGIDGLARGLHSHPSQGLDPNEENLEFISLYQLKNQTWEKEVAKKYPGWQSQRTHFEQRSKVFGYNRLPELEPVRLLNIIKKACQDKMLILLMVSAVFSLCIGIYQDITLVEYNAQGHTIPKVKWMEGASVIFAVSLVVLISSINDYQKEIQFRALNAKKEERQITVIRLGMCISISVDNVQVGDVLQLNAGDIVCADGIVIEGQRLRCDESPLTGETDPVEKVCLEKAHEEAHPFLMSGSKILEGQGTFMATSVGERSFQGRNLMTLRTQDQMTPLQVKLDTLATQIANIGLFVAVSLFLLLLIKFGLELYHGNVPTGFGLYHKQKPTVASGIASRLMSILILSITVVVVAVPEGLPLAVTLALAYATQKMLKDNNLVRSLAACETMGSVTAICSDKTGTLTQNKMEVVAGTFGSSCRFLKHPPQSRHDLIPIHKIASELPFSVQNLIQESILLNSTAHHNLSVGHGTESALLQFARNYLKTEPADVVRARYPVYSTLPFNSSSKKMSTVVKLPKSYRVYMKGAAEEIVRQCRQWVVLDSECNQAIETMAQDDRERMARVIESYATRGLRTLALGYQDLNEPSGEQWLAGLGETAFVLLGIVGIEDPLREGVVGAIEVCQQAGIQVRMITGDHMMTAKSISRQCGIYQPGSLAIEGSDFRRLPEKERWAILPQLRVLARSSPEDKKLLVQDLQKMGETVAVTGDGTNDGLALKAADIGFSMGITGTEVAKEASSIVLLDDNFQSIVKAASWGRCVNDAVRKFLQFQLTVNITAVVLTVISAIASKEQRPILTAVQLLWVNLIMDTFAALALATDRPSPDTMKRMPEPKHAPLINLCMWRMIIGEAFYHISAILILLYTDILALDHDPARLQTVIFTAYVFCQLFNEINCRRVDRQLNVFEGIGKNSFFMFILLVSLCGQILIVEYGGAAFQTVPLGFYHWYLCVIIGSFSIPLGFFIRIVSNA
ncbi:PMCA-type calcium-translocating P-type ATPase [Sporodiniella umbellata]|nr:PMCA-type calcium-translocating P-type ATPase [Sporodiniella umbellata]